MHDRLCMLLRDNAGSEAHVEMPHFMLICKEKLPKNAQTHADCISFHSAVRSCWASDSKALSKLYWKLMAQFI